MSKLGLSDYILLVGVSTILAVIIIVLLSNAFGFGCQQCREEQYIEMLEIDVITHISDPDNHVIDWVCTEPIEVNNFRDNPFSRSSDIYFKGSGTCALLKER